MAKIIQIELPSDTNPELEQMMFEYISSYFKGITALSQQEYTVRIGTLFTSL